MPHHSERSFQIRHQFDAYCILTTSFGMILPNAQSIQALLHPSHVIWNVLSEYAFKLRFTALLPRCVERSLRIHPQFEVHCILTALFGTPFPNTPSIRCSPHFYHVIWNVLSEHALNLRCAAFLPRHLERSFQIRHQHALPSSPPARPGPAGPGPGPAASQPASQPAGRPAGQPASHPATQPAIRPARPASQRPGTCT